MLVPDLTSYSNLYRPPSEAFSLILQITIGCSHNKCSFCSMYKEVQFHIKSFEQIKAEIDYFRSRAKYVNRIFLADGDALIVPTEKLIEILKYIKNIFPECERISTYASPKSLELKSDNYINLKGNLPEDKKRLIQEIDISLNKHSLKEKKYRLL